MPVHHPGGWRPIQWWILTTHGRRTHELAALRAAGIHGLAWVELRSPTDVRVWLDSLAMACLSRNATAS